MYMKFILTFILLTMSISGYSQKTDKKFLEELLSRQPELFGQLLKNITHNEVQILYTQIDRDKNNVPHFKQFSYRLDPEWYFYPASTVKLPAAIFALEKLNNLNIKGLNANSSMLTDSSFAGQTKVLSDSSAFNNKPSIAQYIKKILLVSDNDAFNRLYEFIGREEINAKLKQNGLTNSRIINRLAIGDSGESSRNTNPIRFVNSNGEELYNQEAQYDAENYQLDLKNLIRGKGYLDVNDQLVNKPFDFSNKNAFSIEDQQKILRKLIFPEVYPDEEKFKLSSEDYNLIYKYMSMYPSESDFPKYSKSEYWDTYCKFLFYGSDKNDKPDPSIRIFNKVGDSYGYLIDNAYFVDFKNKVEFMLTAVVQSNQNEIYNDNVYEYDSVGLPFMKNLGETIYQQELKRKKKHLPDLSKFKLEYE